MGSLFDFLSFCASRIVNFPSKFRFRMNLIRHWSTVGWFIDRATWEFGLPERRLKPVPLETIFPGIENFSGSIHAARLWDRQRGTSIEVEELCVLQSLVKFLQCKKILEVGTYDGNTALNFALNLPEDGKVVTLDLPAAQEKPKLALSVRRSNANPSQVIGRQLKNSPAASKVELVREDTALLDWQRLPGPFDLIFIDGCHDNQYVKNDTQKAKTVLKKGGVLVWHDYNLDGVGKFVDEFSEKYPCHWIRGTRLVICRSASER